MSSKPLRIITIGNLRVPFFKDAAAHYRKRLGFYFKLKEDILKDGPGSLPPAERSAVEGRDILAAITPADIMVCLDERGKNLKSTEFAAMLSELTENGVKRPCFVIGGAYGLDNAVLKASRFTVCLSNMTFTHEMARVILLEQIYRAETIIRKMPYHH